MTESQQEQAIKFLAELVEALEGRNKLGIWETALLSNAKEILKNDS